MNEMNHEIMQMIEDYSMMRSNRKAHEADDADSDSYGYEFEPLDTFSTDPLGFTERTMRLHTEVTEMFRFFRKINRHSPLFIKMSGRFEKLVSLLGSCCITKAVMEQQGKTFRLLDSLTIDYLRGMTAFSLRKCHAAFLETRNAGCFGHTLLELSVRWAALDIRLEATGETIEKIKAGKINIGLSEIVSSAEPQKENSENKEKRTAPLPAKGAALPIDKAAVRKSDESLPEENITPVLPSVPEPETSGPEISEAAETERSETPEEREETFKRNILMQDAVNRRDKEAFGAAYNAKGAELDSLWDSFMKRDAADGFTVLRSMGIAVDTADPPPEAEPEPAEVFALETGY